MAKVDSFASLDAIAQAELGHELVETSPSVSGEVYTLALGTLWTSGCTWTIDRWARILNREPTMDQFEPPTAILYEMGKQHSASAYLQALENAQSIAGDVAKFLTKYDVWLTPTVNEPLAPLGYFAPVPENPLQGWFHSGDFSAFTTICNLTGQPAMSMPPSFGTQRVCQSVRISLLVLETKRTYSDWQRNWRKPDLGLAADRRYRLKGKISSEKRTKIAKLECV